MKLSKKLIDLGMVGLVTSFLTPLAAQAECLSVVPGACSGGTYNSDVVIEWYKPTYRANLINAMTSILNPEEETREGCYFRCNTDYIARVEACENLTSDHEIVGSSPVDICIDIAEQRYRDCISFLKCP